MSKIITGVLISAILVPSSPAGAGEVFRNAQGHIVGSSTTAATGVTTFRDAQGHITGTSSTAATGVTTFRDAQGHVTGTASRPKWRR